MAQRDEGVVGCLPCQMHLFPRNAGGRNDEGRLELENRMSGPIA